MQWARFADRDAYVALADDPAQEAFYAARLAPLLDDDVRWMDGDWSERLVAP